MPIVTRLGNESLKGTVSIRVNDPESERNKSVQVNQISG